MLKLLKKRKNSPTERLLIIRENAGDDQRKHDYYHKVINRYQKIVLKAYVFQRQYRWYGLMRTLFPFLKR